MLNRLPRPAIFAHRGASAYAPENTSSAFELAIQQKADAIELDVKLSADERVVVIHDQRVDRTTDGSGQVQHLSLAELRSLDAGSHFDPQFQGEKIPTLEEVFDKYGKKIYFNVELTNYANPIDALPLRVSELIKEFGLQESVLFSSFNPLALIRANQCLPEVSNGLLIGRGFLGVLGHPWIRKFIPYKALHLEFSITTTEMVKQSHRKGYRVHVFTINDAREMNSLFAMGVDGIFTDDPLLARKVIGSSSANKY